MAEPGVGNEAVATVKSRQFSATIQGLANCCRKPEGAKRQRTASASPSPSRDQRRLTSQAADSDEGPTVRNGGAKKIRGAAARNHREKELREEREKSRAEAQRKRQGRAERRRVG